MINRFQALSQDMTYVSTNGNVEIYDSCRELYAIAKLLDIAYRAGEIAYKATTAQTFIDELSAQIAEIDPVLSRRIIRGNDRGGPMSRPIADFGGGPLT